jgi:hypothetical protein
MICLKSASFKLLPLAILNWTIAYGMCSCENRVEIFQDSLIPLNFAKTIVKFHNSKNLLNSHFERISSSNVHKLTNKIDYDTLLTDAFENVIEGRFYREYSQNANISKICITQMKQLLNGLKANDVWSLKGIYYLFHYSYILYLQAIAHLLLL